jgi:16S rRNA (guanine527-N7)-methyltransferase
MGAGDPEAAWDRLAGGAGELGVPLSDEQLDQLRSFVALLCEWNEKFNLTATTRLEDLVEKHLLDSLSCAAAVDFSARETLIDVGTGAGFPGLVLKIAFPHLRVTLLDSLRKRLQFLDRAAADLGLGDVVTVHARAEDAAREPGDRLGPVETPASPYLRERFDVVTSRAVARLNVLAEWTVPFASVGGIVLAMKGPDMSDEVEEARRALRLLGAGQVDVRHLVLPGTDYGRSLVLLRKTRPTPNVYPRRPGTAKRDPL